MWAAVWSIFSAVGDKVRRRVDREDVSAALVHAKLRQRRSAGAPGAATPESVRRSAKREAT